MISSIILLLHLIGLIDVNNAVILLCIIGVLLITADFTLGLFFLVAFNGFIALALATGLMFENQDFWGIGVNWGLFFGIAVFELLLLIPFAYMLKRANERKSIIGNESMIGETAKIEHWDGIQGRVRIHGESWQAQAKRSIQLNQGDSVEIEDVQNLTLVVKAL